MRVWRSLEAAEKLPLHQFWERPHRLSRVGKVYLIMTVLTRANLHVGKLAPPVQWVAAVAARNFENTHSRERVLFTCSISLHSSIVGACWFSVQLHDLFAHSSLSRRILLAARQVVAHNT